uniref:Serine/threonine-protein kinase PLK n=1 Tax=Phallusia mammillata TaxID=59560 RepID=A0A6F9DNC4_9ASCI|nr:serine/threonine-protein kinase PLK3 [Phallusia mammillata]
MCDITAETHYSYTKQRSMKQANNDNMKHSEMEADSGICTTLHDKLRESFSNFSVSRRSSACSTHCPSTYLSIPASSGQETAPSSAYSSAASSCCESESHKTKPNVETSKMNINGTVYAKCNNNNNSSVLRNHIHSDLGHRDTTTSSLQVKLPSTARTHRRARKISSASSTKSDHVIPEETRRLVDPATENIYEKKRLLGKGGFARVYEVVQINQPECQRLQPRSCAAKIIDKSRLVRPQQREKVEQEVELMQTVRGHRNIVSYYSSFEDESAICILLELCNKKSLAQYLRRKQYLVEQEVCNITRQIVEGLSHLHGKGIIHRDLKLGNILLTDDMTVKIGDFGLAAKMDAGKKKTICGTPNFIAPEVLQRQGHGPEADIWALGCLLYTLLVGKPPFETACLRDTYRCILKNNYRIPTTVSPEAADLVKSMLRQKPKSRPTLDEIKSHAFFTKHSSYLDTIEIAPSANEPGSVTATPDVSATRSFRGTIPTSPTAEDSIALQSITHVAEKTIVDTPTRDMDDGKVEKQNPGVSRAKLSESSGTKSPVRRIASRLHKQLCKVPSPGKCVRAAAMTFKDSKKTSANQKPALESVAQEATMSPNTAGESTSSPTWVSKWVDYSNRYGFGYQLANGRICVLFNDGKHLAALPCGKKMEYVSADQTGAVYFACDEVPPTLERYVNMLRNFISYMERNLSRNSSVASATKANNSARLMTWHRTDEYVAMYLSDGTLQINFCNDHVKINISNLHRQSAMHLTVIDQERNLSTYTGCAMTSSYVFPGLVKRLEVIHELFHLMFADVKCDSHPFCQVCSRCLLGPNGIELRATDV